MSGRGARSEGATAEGGATPTLEAFLARHGLADVALARGPRDSATAYARRAAVADFPGKRSAGSYARRFSAGREGQGVAVLEAAMRAGEEPCRRMAQGAVVEETFAEAKVRMHIARTGAGGHVVEIGLVGRGSDPATSRARDEATGVAKLRDVPSTWMAGGNAALAAMGAMLDALADLAGAERGTTGVDFVALRFDEARITIDLGDEAHDPAFGRFGRHARHVAAAAAAIGAVTLDCDLHGALVTRRHVGTTSSATLSAARALDAGRRAVAASTRLAERTTDLEAVLRDPRRPFAEVDAKGGTGRGEAAR